MSVENVTNSGASAGSQFFTSSNRTGGSALDLAYGSATGEAMSRKAIAVGSDRSGASQTPPTTKIHQVPREMSRAFRVYWLDAIDSAKRMEVAAAQQDQVVLALEASRFEYLLAQLWKYRQHRDVNWKSILNHLQGIIASKFKCKSIESLKEDQCHALWDVAERYLGPSTKSDDDLVDCVQILSVAGFDPFALISDPEF